MRRRRMAQRRSFGLVEVLVGLTILGVVSTVLWTAFSTTLRRQVSTDATLQGLQSCILFDERLEGDLRTCCVDEHHGIEVSQGPEPTLRFHRYPAADPATPDRNDRLRPVCYVFVPAEYAVYRREGEAGAERLPGRYEHVVFRLRPTIDYQRLPPWVDDIAEPPPPADSLDVLAIAIPEEYTVTPRRLWKRQHRSLSWTSYPVVGLRGRWSHPTWVANPHRPPRFVR